MMSAQAASAGLLRQELTSEQAARRQLESQVQELQEQLKQVSVHARCGMWARACVQAGGVVAVV